MRRHEDTGHPTWVAWLKHRARERGYDVDAHGVKARLANDTGIAAATISRAFNGVVPEYDTLRTLARHLDIQLAELLIRTGKAEHADFGSGGSYADHSGVLSENPLSPEEVAVAAGVPEEHRDWFATMVRQMRKEDQGGSTTGGAVAEG